MLNKEQIEKVKMATSKYLSFIRKQLPNEVKTYRRYYKLVPKPKFIDTVIRSMELENSQGLQEEISALMTNVAESAGYLGVEKTDKVIIPTQVDILYTNHIFNLSDDDETEKNFRDGRPYISLSSPANNLVVHTIKSRNSKLLLPNIANAIDIYLKKVYELGRPMDDVLYKEYCVYYNVVKYIFDKNNQKLLDWVSCNYDIDFSLTRIYEDDIIDFLQEILSVLISISNDYPELVTRLTNEKDYLSY